MRLLCAAHVRTSVTVEVVTDVRMVMTGDDMLLSGASAGDDIHFTSRTERERNR